MTDEQMETPVRKPALRQQPRLVLMGEFSAGKSTLSNMLLGSRPLPMRVTATRLPPVEITHGPEAAFAVAMDGSRSEIDLENLEAVSLDETRSIELHMEAELLEHCALVDMPGVSDPSMQQQYWENVVGPKDHVIWCTHATQAWRQSEAAIWNVLRPNARGTNLLLITQFDKLRNDRDKKRVLKRMERETDGLFDAIYPVSLLQALEAGDDEAAWEASGAADLSAHIARIVARQSMHELEAQEAALNPNDEKMDPFQAPAQFGADPEAAVVPRRIQARPARIASERMPARALPGLGQ